MLGDSPVTCCQRPARAHVSALLRQVAQVREDFENFRGIRGLTSRRTRWLVSAGVVLVSTLTIACILIRWWA